MAATSVIFIITIIAMILSVLFFPKLKIGKISVDTYWLITMLGAIILLCASLADAKEVGSNIGAFLTPIGALAGIMWSSILSKHGEKFSYLDFIKMGVVVSIPTLFAALGALWIIFLI